jgi:hypothetical protein
MNAPAGFLAPADRSKLNQFEWKPTVGLHPPALLSMRGAVDTLRVEGDKIINRIGKIQRAGTNGRGPPNLLSPSQEW